MKFRKYIADRFVELVISIFVGALILLLMAAFRIPTELMIVIAMLLTAGLAGRLTWDFMRKKRYYDKLQRNLMRLDQKYLVLETVGRPNFYEGELLHESLYEANKSMREHVREYESSMQEFKDYIEMWVHEVKLPLSSLLLMCHNRAGEIGKVYVEQLQRIDNYTEQVLYYVRSEHAEHDYLFKKISLSRIIHNVAMKNKDNLLENAFELIVENCDKTVLTDSKWMEFILNQMVSNSIKYKDKDHPQIRISAEESVQMITLHFWDNGIGIPASDVPQVFKKSFTGINGRRHAQSTGMGMYIAKKLCDQLGHSIFVQSKEGGWTEFCITFYKNDFYVTVQDS